MRLELSKHPDGSYTLKASTKFLPSFSFIINERELDVVRHVLSMCESAREGSAWIHLEAGRLIDWREGWK